jgi:DNA mismatch endonuclease (patch repair protein)
MADVFSPKRRSEIMSNVKGRENKATEIRLLKIFQEFGITGWRRHAAVFGKPDFTFYSARLAVFVDGCFWHACPIHGTIPTTNREFWKRKISRNSTRDRFVGRELKKKNWRVMRIWQHELQYPRRVARRVARSLSG